MSEIESPIESMRRAIRALEAQRPLLGDAVANAALAPLLQQLAYLEAAGPRRRLVTVLFLDMVGSTAMSRTLDPEDVHDIMDTALQAFSKRVTENGGKVLQYAGDSLLAAFGAAAGREDDAERAVHAGLALLAEAQAQADRVQALHGQFGFGVRVGVHTGHVLLGGGVDEEGSIRGFTVNIAARLEQEAPPGTLRISHDTWRHVRGVFEVAAQPPLKVKGQEEPLRTYLVLGARPRAFRVPTRGIEGMETPLIGRDAELDALLGAFELTMRTRSLQAVTVIAQAGLGKSRLMHELQHKLEEHPQTFWLLLGRAQPGSSLQPYGLLRDVLAWRLQIADSDSADQARTRLVDGMAPLFEQDGELQAELIGRLIGMDFSASPRLQLLINEPRQLRDRALGAFTTYLRQLAASDGSPVVLLLDDLQWADDASLDWLAQLMQTADLPLTMLMAARPELVERRNGWGTLAPQHTRMTLDALDADQRSALTRSLLSRVTGDAAALHSLIETRAEGNPFYAEELLKMLIDEGVVAIDGELWHLHVDRLRSALIPGTLTGVLQARLDALSAPERHALQMASVVGPVFWDTALCALDPKALNSLPVLQARSMVQIHAESTFANAREQRFHHHLLHQVTYDTVLKSERRAGHSRAAQWLAERVGDREAEYLAVTAEHYDRAGDIGHAIEWYWKAQRVAADGFAHASSLAYLRRLQSLTEPGDGPGRWAICKSLSYVGNGVGDHMLQREAVDEGEAIAERLDSDAIRAWVYSTRALMADRRGDRAEASEFATRAIRVAESSDSAVQAALAHGELAWLATERGDAHTALAHVESGLVWAARAAQQMLTASDDMYEMQLLLVLAQVHSVEYDIEQEEAAALRALKLAEASRHHRVHASCHGALCECALALGDVERASMHADRLEALARQTGVATLLGQAGERHAQIALATDRFDVAAVAAREASDTFGRIGARSLEARCLTYEALALAGSGSTAAARRALERAIELRTATNDSVDASACRLLVADTLRAEGDLAGALSAVRAEQGMLAKDGVLNDSTLAVTARAAAWRVLRAADQPDAVEQLTLAAEEIARRTRKISDPAARGRARSVSALYREILAASGELSAIRPPS